MGNIINGISTVLRVYCDPTDLDDDAKKIGLEVIAKICSVKALVARDYTPITYTRGGLYTIEVRSPKILQGLDGAALRTAIAIFARPPGLIRVGIERIH